MTMPDPRAEDDTTVEELIEQSSLGTPGAKALRCRTPPEVVDRIMEQAERLHAAGVERAKKRAQKVKEMRRE